MTKPLYKAYRIFPKLQRILSPDADREPPLFLSELFVRRHDEIKFKRKGVGGGGGHTPGGKGGSYPLSPLGSLSMGFSFLLFPNRGPIQKANFKGLEMFVFS